MIIITTVVTIFSAAAAANTKTPITTITIGSKSHIAFTQGGRGWVFRLYLPKPERIWMKPRI